jgi:hypothetical protein
VSKDTSKTASVMIPTIMKNANMMVVIVAILPLVVMKTAVSVKM